MKKNIKIVMMVATVALVAGINVYNSQKTVAMSDIALTNVEALAQSEVEFPYICTGTSWNCVDDYYFQTFQGDKVQ